MTGEYISYQLVLTVNRPLRFRAGALGPVELAPGRYVYTGSARRNLEARIRRHLSRHKRLHWHIDYLLAQPGVQVVEVLRSARPECQLNQSLAGEIPVPGFGASDCRRRCGAHLKKLA